MVDRNDNDAKIVYNYCDNSNYALEELRSGGHDFNLIKKCFSTKVIRFDKFASSKEFTMKVYRVINRKSNDTREDKSNNILLFHGTNVSSAVGILEKGFKPSNKGIYGPGVYLTASSRSAMQFSSNKGQKSDKKKEFVVLVNEVLDSENLKEIYSYRYASFIYMTIVSITAPFLFLTLRSYFDSVNLANTGLPLWITVLVVNSYQVVTMFKKHSHPRKYRFERYTKSKLAIKSSV